MTENKADPLLPCPFCGSENIESLVTIDVVSCQDCGAFLEEVEPSARALWNTRATRVSPQESVGTSIPLADHDEIGRKIIGQPWAIQSAIVTIAAHCKMLVGRHPTGDVADLAGCISECCAELATALADRQPTVDPLRYALQRIAWLDPGAPIGEPPDPQYFIRQAQGIAREALAAAQPAAPLGGREAIARIIDPEIFTTLDEIEAEKCNEVTKRYVRRHSEDRRVSALTKADAILAAIPQERGVERSSIIAECAQVVRKIATQIIAIEKLPNEIRAERGLSEDVVKYGREVAYLIECNIRALGKETGQQSHKGVF